MKSLKYLLSLVCLVVVTSLQAQSDVSRCATHEYSLLKGVANPGYANAVAATFEQALENAHHNPAFAHRNTLRVPVVVHVVYHLDQENISDELIQAQINQLNLDYRRLNDNASDTREEFLPVAADAQIEFYLAELDPEGNTTTGITHTYTDREDFNIAGDLTVVIEALAECGVTDITDYGQLLANLPCVLAALEAAGIDIYDLIGGTGTTTGLDEMKFDDTGGINAWPTDQYLNIWVCNLAGDLNAGLGGGILGFAYPPADAPNWPAGQSGTPETDGVVIHYQVIGPDNPQLELPYSSVVGNGRTAVHEVGHYLGLRHIWGDGACAEDDGIEDTPPADGQSQQDCDYTKNTCTESPVELPDMIENYMDYSDEDCMNVFTQGQVDIMRAMLLGPRSSLLNSETELTTPNADFIASSTEVLTGESVLFTSTITGGAIETINWNFGDGNTSTEANPVYVYNTPGVYDVTLTVTNSLGFDSETKTAYMVDTGNAIGIAEQLIDGLVTVPPNPSKGVLYVNFEQPVSTMATIEVFNVAGEKIRVITTNNNETLQLANEANGVYFVQISVNEQRFTKRIVLQK